MTILKFKFFQLFNFNFIFLKNKQHKKLNSKLFAAKKLQKMFVNTLTYLNRKKTGFKSLNTFWNEKFKNKL